jgi:hypothetical protein
MGRRQMLRLSARAGAGIAATAALGTAAASCTTVLPGAAPGVALLPSRIPLPAPFTTVRLARRLTFLGVVSSYC